MPKSKKYGSVILSVVLSLLFCYTCAYAGNGVAMGNVKQITNVSEYRGIKEARVKGSPRGEFISSVDIKLTDKGRGTLGIYADLLCHEPMKELRMWLYLEKWSIEKEDWITVAYEQFSWAAEDFPDEDLTMAVVSYDVSKLERGQDYHIRGLFGADPFSGTMGETWALTTPDFFLE